jgi:hypothetical protein
VAVQEESLETADRSGTQLEDRKINSHPWTSVIGSDVNYCSLVRLSRAALAEGKRISMDPQRRRICLEVAADGIGDSAQDAIAAASLGSESQSRVRPTDPILIADAADLSVREIYLDHIFR